MSLELSRALATQAMDVSQKDTALGYRRMWESLDELEECFPFPEDFKEVLVLLRQQNLRTPCRMDFIKIGAIRANLETLYLRELRERK